MGDDKEVLREVWEGRLPVSFNISPDEVTTVEQPEPCYLLVPRMSYFPLVTDKVFRHFQKASNQDDINEMWLEHNGQPLKWHYPIGVLYDLYASKSLPWNITLHFKRYPESEIIRCHGREGVEAHFMSTVKEADSLKHRSAVMNSMKKNDHRQLWLGLCNDKFDQFWSINKRLMERLNSEPFRNIPLRVYYPDGLMIQKLQKTVSDKGDLYTLRDFLKSGLPDDFSQDQVKGQYELLLQGVKPPLETPLQWLSEHLSYPDNFLHLVLVSTK